ncbi:hypothetical protein A2W24_05280 [Microgenomates group bacterium RBG_16_45_19]|nr:MAG: hypothetical protein A2W24_05280 [Microgenomates group bacterium RBG_16_45_19]
MNNTIVQVPVSKSLRDRAAAAASDLGFSSLQESIRIFMANLAKRQINITISPAKKIDEYTLSPRAIRRYEKLIRDIESGEEPVYTANSPQELIDQLHGRIPPKLANQSEIPKALRSKD